MGSLNGDVVVMRNGRSTSQVSIYNYPEHLNPFYEDDQHKRLRFWKVSKKDNEGRRNSFSIGNLKDMWAFKSFRLKKKSSTLGITKTSESPPPLRREFVVDNGWNSFDHRLRDSRTSSTNSDNFQRNATYRSSLQNLPSNNDRTGFNRNDDYRSTIQVPRPNPRYHQPQTQPRRSSQSSMVSSNPFESDIDDDNEDVNGMRSANGDSTSTLSKLTPRKKRRAPAPPTPLHDRSNGAGSPTIAIESSQNDAQSDLCIREDTDIANLTAEIESFVKNKNNDDVETSVVITENQVGKVTPEAETRNAVGVQDNIKTTTTITTTTTASVPTTDSNNASAVGREPVTQGEVITSTPTKQQQPQTDGQAKPEILTAHTTTTSTITESTTPVNGQASAAPTAEAQNWVKTVTQAENHKEVKSNGAIPKNTNNTAAEHSPKRVDNVDLCIEETSELAQRPMPVPRTSKPESEVGHVECIHVHVGSPSATPRQEHANSVTSFKKEQHVEPVEIITTKTPFILTSPPRQRKTAQQTVLTKETVKMQVQEHATTGSYELTINEQQLVKSKPEVMAKPALSPKPTVERNGKVHTYAEIHKPMRSKTANAANGHVRCASREETVAAPSVPHQQVQEQQKVEKVVATTSASKTEAEQKKTEKHVTISEPEVSRTDLNIEEDRPAISGQPTKISLTTSQSPPPAEASHVETDVVERREINESTQLESLYRPQYHLEWKRSTLAPLETNIPPEKRKSVKDIIESINRSQRLLHAAANKDFTIVTGPPASSAQNTDSCEENLRILDESQQEIRRMVQQIDRLDHSPEAATTNGTSSPSSEPPSYSECIAAQKLDNSEIFQKCTVKKEVYDYRESSPITSNLDWNPVPKPKRTKPQHE